MIQPIKQIDNKLTVREADYIAALYSVLQLVGSIIVKAEAFKNSDNCKDLICVEYNKELDAYRFKLKKKRNRGIVTPNKELIV